MFFYLVVLVFRAVCSLLLAYLLSFAASAGLAARIAFRLSRLAPLAWGPF
jgi:hypothetical protein